MCNKHVIAVLSQSALRRFTTKLEIPRTSDARFQGKDIL
jgi:hypothetical protein